MTTMGCPAAGSAPPVPPVSALSSGSDGILSLTLRGYAMEPCTCCRCSENGAAGVEAGVEGGAEDRGKVGAERIQTGRRRVRDPAYLEQLRRRP